MVVLLIIVSFISYNEWPLITGKKIVLATHPIDPFDPFRGQYITINYEISRVNNNKDFKEGDWVYVSLKEDEQGVWRMQNISSMAFERGDFIKGKVSRAYGKEMWIEYGIEQFFFERNAKLPTQNITIEVSVASSGRAKISQLLQNGKPVEIKYEKFDIKS
jgi:uncharacterized membrane-anchored protein